MTPMAKEYASLEPMKARRVMLSGMISWTISCVHLRMVDLQAH